MKLLSKLTLVLSLFSVGIVPVFNVFAAAEAQPFATAQQVDLTRILPPPPVNDSAQTRRELQEVVDIQERRTSEMASKAKADEEEDIWAYSDVNRPGFPGKY